MGGIGMLVTALLLLAAASGTGALEADKANEKKASEDEARRYLTEQGFDESYADQILNEYAGTDFNLFDRSTWGKRHTTDIDAMKRDYDEYQKVLGELGDMPAMPDLDAIASAADRDVDAENAQVLALYDQMLGRSNDAFQRELDSSNAAYNDYVSQTLSNNAMATNAIAGSTRYEMDRARRNAIRRGASAAQQLTASVNAQLGLQNRAAQQQLETSNQLASALLQQRQAAAQLRGDYVNNLNADASRRAGLISGTAERKNSLRRGYQSEAWDRYYADRGQWNDRIYGALGDNPYADVYKRQQTRNAKTNTYGY
jgi:hypothetical protein